MAKKRTILEPNADDDITSVQNYHAIHQSLGEKVSDRCRACKATQEYNEYAPISEVTGTEIP
ncbi:MAG: hypothetical protein JRN68_00085 [Nitrososphaerota archaeon]|nr:hypothetical protein [Nitrososphaerota archaeon]